MCEEIARGAYAVQDANDAVIESGLSEVFARYFVTLRALTDDVLGQHRSRPHRVRLRAALQTSLQEVGARWVFVAPGDDGEHYFMHDCVRTVGRGRLDRADALFLDAAKSALPILLEMASPPPAEDGRRRLFIPKREIATDATAEYRGFAAAERPLSTLSGRNDLPKRTEAMIAAIFRHLDFPYGCRVLDIGCGDATLLRTVAPQAARTVGTVLTGAERQKLAAEPRLAGITFAAASFETIDEIAGPFDRIIANGCLHFVRTALGADRAFAKLAALLAPGGQLWAGELHAKDWRRLTFTSKIAALRHARACHGRAFALAFARHLWRHRRRADLIVARPPTDCWHVTPEALRALAARHGLEVAGSWSCLDLTGDTFYALQDRFSCLLAKP